MAGLNKLQLHSHLSPNLSARNFPEKKEKEEVNVPRLFPLADGVLALFLGRLASVKKRKKRVS